MAAYQLDDPLPSPPPCNVEQSYERWFQPDVDGTPGNDQFLYLHPNGLCLVGVAPAHAALRPPQPAGGEAGASTAAGAAAAEPVQVDAGAAAAAAATQPAEQPAAGASGSEPAAPAAAAGSAAAAAAGSPLQQDGGEGAAESKPPPPASISFKVGRRNLLEAEYRKGRGPCLNPDAGLCRWVALQGGTFLESGAGQRSFQGICWTQSVERGGRPQ